MDKGYIIKNELKRVGSSAYIVDKSWSSMPFFCSLQETFSKNKSQFEEKITPAGIVNAEYFLYIGPFDHNIKALSCGAVLCCKGQRYVFKKKEEICFENKTLYYTAIVRKIQEDDIENQ